MLYYYTLIIAYDGTGYKGWQYQPTEKTVEGILRTSFYKVFHSPMSIVSASRTDSGVHALGQVARICTTLNLESQKIKEAWNNSLPPDILIVSLQRSSKDIHPRKNVATKTYWYHFFLKRPLPFSIRFGWFFPYTIKIEDLYDYLQLFVGTHDFRSFCTGYEHLDTIRTIDTINLSYNHEWNAFRITVQGKRFLRHMIRRIIGAAFYVAYKKNKYDYLEYILASKNPNHLLPTAPAKGLFLYRIEYKK